MQRWGLDTGLKTPGHVPLCSDMLRRATLIVAATAQYFYIKYRTGELRSSECSERAFFSRAEFAWASENTGAVLYKNLVGSK